MDSGDNSLGLFINALAFSARQHNGQHRKDSGESPYINHPIEVTRILWQEGDIRDMPVLLAALLHDTLEDTVTQKTEEDSALQQEIALNFGKEVLSLVLEVTDDKSLDKAVRKQLQVEHAPHLSMNAKLIKLADKISNVRDVIGNPPRDWGGERRLNYLYWSKAVVDGIRGVNAKLEATFDAAYMLGITTLQVK